MLQMLTMPAGPTRVTRLINLNTPCNTYNHYCSYPRIITSIIIHTYIHSYSYGYYSQMMAPSLHPLLEQLL